MGSLFPHGFSLAVIRCLLASTFLVAACDPAPESRQTVELASVTFAAIGDRLLDDVEQCDDGNSTSGDGCSSDGTIEAGYLCQVAGRPCSLASLCGNNVVNSGEACDDGNNTDNGNGCSETCGFSLCGNGVLNHRAWPNFDQETCDDGNRLDGDGCSSLCTVEPGFGCTRNAPSHCVATGVRLFSTGVDDLGRRLESGSDPYWRYQGTTTSASFGVRSANDWPHELPDARFMAALLGAPTCVYQDIFIPSTKRLASFHLDIATFNDNAFDEMQLNSQPRTPVTFSEAPGQPWQKNIFRRLGAGAFRHGENRIVICNENSFGVPNAFRYLAVDADDDSCGDGLIASRERCDDGNVANGDGCSSTCLVEVGRVCTGEPSRCAATCGNGVLNAGEECDDGNGADGDGCSNRCQVERGYGCSTVGATCAQTCGDGVLAHGEECDDHNLVSGDGCSDACRIERGYVCLGQPSSCTARCGNGVLDAGELCDDGNLRSADGCSNACTLEAGYACPTAGQPCAATCGNGQMNPGEGCDDGGRDGGDGCSAECAVESGYACSMPASGPSICAATCGNGTLDANETCDDANTVDGDGCSRGCRVAIGFSCSGAPSTCATLCGDGILAGAEQCDDGNGVGDDGCSTACMLESTWACLGASCAKTCGNGVRNAGEDCDDGNVIAGDGCSASCRRETGFACSGSPDVCVPLCGDGIRAATEACDDGNFLTGDGCTPQCVGEAGASCAVSLDCEIRCNTKTLRCVDDDIAPPAPVITAPLNASLLLDLATVSGTAEAESTVTIVIDGTTIGTTTASAAGTFEFALTTQLHQGAHVLEAYATDADDNEGPSSAPIMITVVECLGDESCASGTETCDLAGHRCVPVVVGEVDAGVEVDASVAPDAGSVEVDAGVGPDDDVEVDAGVGPDVDAGPRPGRRGESGCSIATAGSNGRITFIEFMLAMAAICVVRRRRALTTSV